VSVNVAEAKQRLSDLLGRVAYGRETVLITRRVRPMARLVPPDETGRQGPHLGARLAARRFPVPRGSDRGGPPKTLTTRVAQPAPQSTMSRYPLDTNHDTVTFVVCVAELRYGASRVADAERLWERIGHEVLSRIEIHPPW